MAQPKRLEITLPGRPVPWARARRSKWGGFFTPERQKDHRETLAQLIAVVMRENKTEQRAQKRHAFRYSSCTGTDTKKLAETWIIS
jgi:hypothetical protein